MLEEVAAEHVVGANKACKSLKQSVLCKGVLPDVCNTVPTEVVEGEAIFVIVVVEGIPIMVTVEDGYVTVGEGTIAVVYDVLEAVSVKSKVVIGETVVIVIAG